MTYRIRIDTEAHNDIQTAITWDNQQKKDLGKKFHADIKKSLEKLKLNPGFQIRYENVRCMSVKKYPFMIHFTIDEPARLVVVRAVFHTSLDPEHWQKRK